MSKQSPGSSRRKRLTSTSFSGGTIAVASPRNACDANTAPATPRRSRAMSRCSVGCSSTAAGICGPVSGALPSLIAIPDIVESLWQLVDGHEEVLLVPERGLSRERRDLHPVAHDDRLFRARLLADPA